MGRRAFTLVEVVVVIGVLAALVALALPALARARDEARVLSCGSRLRQIGIATGVYLGDWREALPQTRVPVDGGADVRATVFGGVRGALPVFGVSETGAADRPLNPYVAGDAALDDAGGAAVELPVFRSPCDRGAKETYLGIEGFESPPTLAWMMGTSYVLNDHGLDGEHQRTLIPEGGGRMPEVLDASRTWLAGSGPIYNFRQDTDRGMRWYGAERCAANLVFVDLHAELRVPVPDELCVVENETERYSFFARPGGR